MNERNVRSDYGGDIPTCRGCRHFFITYDPRYPLGCRAMGFKGRRNPHIEVQSASGAPCRLREIRTGWDEQASGT